MTVSVRSYLTVGVAVLAAGAVAVAPVQTPAPQSISTAAVRLSAAVQPLVEPANAAAAVLGVVSAPAPTIPKPAAAGTPQAAVTASNSAGDAIITIYNAAQPWVQWGFAVTAWAASYVPIAGYFAQQINIAYNTGQPIVGSWVYSFAALLDGNVSTIPSILQTGVTTAVNNLIQGEIQWIAGYLPPLPPIPHLAATAPSKSAAAAAAVAAPAAMRSVNPTHALRTRIVTAVEGAVAPATDAVGGTTKTVADPANLKADSTDTAKKARPADGSARDHSAKTRAAHNPGE